ncbi:MAG TPA: DUF4340 domain-containing protein [Gammaproteobacteria bacterium]
MSLRSRQGLNLGLVALVLGLLALYHFKSESPDSSGLPVLVPDAAKLQSIRLDLAGKPEVQLQRTGEAWRVLKPMDWPADAVQVQDFLDSLSAPVENQFPAQGEALSQYGLDKPLLRLWLDGVEYDFGAQQPVSKQRYVHTGDSVKLIDDYVFYRTAHDAYGWLDHRLLPEGARITAMQLPHATLTQDAKGAWQIAPADASLTAEDFTRFIGYWQKTLASNVVPYAKAKSLGEVSFQLAGIKDPLRMQVLDDPNYLVLARPDLGFEYQVDIRLLQMLMTPSHLAD